MGEKYIYISTVHESNNFIKQIIDDLKATEKFLDRGVGSQVVFNLGESKEKIIYTPFNKKAAKKSAERLITELEKLYPEAICSLNHGGNPWKLLIMARLSAQCTDERVNKVCIELFEKYPDAEALAAADVADIESIIRPCGLYRTKASSIKEASRMIAEEFGGRIPDTMDELLTLPGVGRKVANLVLGDLYGQGGIVADTHFMRICGRLGFCAEGTKDAVKVERIMEEFIPREKQTDLCHRAVLFGRDICTARNPKCAECPLNDICRSEHNGL